MNHYFSNLAAMLTNKENTESNFATILNILPDENYNHSFHLINHTNYNEICKIILNLKSDYDNIPLQYLNFFTEHITSPMMHIINTWIDQDIFQQQCKISRIFLIPKTDNPTSIKDYQQISVLSVLSKVYKHVILNQFCSFIETQNLYNTNQSGFCKGHSTNMLLLKLRDNIRTANNRSEVTLSVLIDYSKSFDTIDHCILLEKLQNMNFAKNTIKIICSYLIFTNRGQEINPIVYFFSVPQGSILGPVLFNLYVAELADHSYFTIIQYAVTPLCIDIARFLLLL